MTLTKNKTRTISVLAITSILMVSLIAAYPPMQAYANGSFKDLSNWTAESYAELSGFPTANWAVSGISNEVATETENAQPTLFVSDFAAQNMKHSVTVNIASTDNDFIGLAVGVEPGDTTDTTADYLLIDWKRGAQPWNFATLPGPVNLCPGGDGNIGLALSRVSGIPDPDELWQHADLSCGAAAGSVAEITRATTLGGSGYPLNTDIVFDILYTTNGIIVLVDGDLEIVELDDYSGISGNLAFYDFSQGSTFKNVSMMNQDPFEGCSPGFWKNDAFKRDEAEWSQTSFYGLTNGDPATTWNDIFDDIADLRVKNGEGTESDPTLLDALNAKGGIPNSFAREAVAALLNANDTNIDYPLTQAQVITLVNAAIGDAEDMENLRGMLWDLNHAGCPV